MKKAVIVHAWGSAPEEHWYREEEKALKKLGFDVFLPALPGGNWPKLDDWLRILNGLPIDEETILIGHSLGVPAILRFLEESKIKVAKVFSIAGFARDLEIEETRNFLDKPFDWEKIKNHIGENIVINEKDDPYVPLECGKEIAKKPAANSLKCLEMYILINWI